MQNRPGSPIAAAVTMVVWAVVLAATAALGRTPFRDPLCGQIAAPLGYDCAAPRPMPARTLRPGDLIDRAGQHWASLEAAACRIAGTAPLSLVAASTALGAMNRSVSYSALATLGHAHRLNAPLPNGPPIDLDASWNDLRRIDVSVGALTSTGIEPAIALRRLAACSVRSRCVDALRTGDSRLVTATLLTTDAHYRLLDRRGAPSDHAALRLLTPDIDLTGPGTLRARAPLVIGTQSLTREQLAALQVCAAPVVYEATGTIAAAISGHGTRGAFGDQRVVQPLGTIAQLFAQGAEVSDCDPDLGRERSRGYVQGQLAQTRAGGLRLAAELRVASGRYRYGRCTPGRRLPSNNTLTNTAEARVHIAGALAVLARYEQAVDLDLHWTGMPPGTVLRVVAPDGRALVTDQIIEGAGRHTLRVAGPGVFRVLPTIDAQLARKGESGVKSFSFNATLDAIVTKASKDG